MYNLSWTLNSTSETRHIYGHLKRANRANVAFRAQYKVNMLNLSINLWPIGLVEQCETAEHNPIIVSSVADAFIPEESYTGPSLISTQLF